MEPEVVTREHARSEEVTRFERIWTEPGGVTGLIRSVNNVPIATRYMAVAFGFLLLGGVQALLMRVQLARAENTFLQAELYNQLFTMHGTTMMFLFVIPFIEALANYMVPLMLGTRDLPFPRLAAYSYWSYVFGGLLLYSSFFFGLAPNGGWFAYVPLTDKEFSPGLNLDFWDIGLSVAEIAAMAAAAELIIAILRMRAPGMSLGRLPIFAWAMLVTAVMIIFAFTPLIVGTAMLELDRKQLTAFFDPRLGGDVLLWQHLFWMFGHPEVYIMLLPAMGITAQLVQTFSRRPLIGYSFVVASFIAIGVISFALWAHHMFSTGVSHAALTFFTGASMLISIPTGIHLFSVVATLWTGRPVWTSALLFAVGSFFIFALGGLTGVMVAIGPFDWQAHDTYFVVAHFHYVLIGGVLFPLIAALYYWLPKITGRLLNERLGRWNFGVMFVFFNLAFFPMHIVGLLGMPRRVYTYPEGLGWELLNFISTIGALGFAAGMFLFVVNFIWSLRHGAHAGPNPWSADTLEWSQHSPVPQAQFPVIPVVRSRYPLWEQRDFEADDRVLARQLKALAWQPHDWRAAVVVSMRAARPLAVVHVPGPTVWPFLTALATLIGFVGALLDSIALLGLGLCVALVALAGWLWPQQSESAAVAQTSDVAEDQLPLASAGSSANGWWGTVVLLLVLGTAYATIVGSHYFLLQRSTLRVPGAYYEAAATCVVLAAAALATFALARSFRRQQPWLQWIPLTTLLALDIVALWLLTYGWYRAELAPSQSAFASVLALVYGFHVLVGILGAVMVGVALAWLWLAPGDPRTRAAALNTSLVSYFATATWLTSFLIFYVIPRL